MTTELEKALKAFEAFAVKNPLMQTPTREERELFDFQVGLSRMWEEQQRTPTEDEDYFDRYEESGDD
jgi:hypothetical protein